MGKKVHPIRKLSRQLWGKNNWDFLDEDERKLSDRVIARHIKPLLEELQKGHTYPADKCKACNLIDLWGAKL